MPAASMVASWRANTEMSPALTLPPLEPWRCLRIREGATPWRRSSARRVCSSGARLLPLIRAPFLSRPSHANGTSRLMVLTVAVAAGAMSYFRPASLDRNAVNFLETSQTVFNLFQPCASEIPDAFFRGLLCNLHRATEREDNFRNRFRDRQDLIDAHATLIAVGAVGASFRSEDLEPRSGFALAEALLEQGLLGDIHRLLAMVAQPSRETLRNDQADRRRDRIGLYAHVDHARQCLRRIVRVQRGEHQVTRLGR